MIGDEPDMWQVPYQFCRIAPGKAGRLRIIVRNFVNYALIETCYYLCAQHLHVRMEFAWSRKCKFQILLQVIMAAFVAKQMVGNKLSAVKGEFCCRLALKVLIPLKSQF